MNEVHRNEFDRKRYGEEFPYQYKASGSTPKPQRGDTLVDRLKPETVIAIASLLAGGIFGPILTQRYNAKQAENRPNTS